MTPEEEISAEDILNMVLDEVDDVIIISDPDHSVLWLNHAARKKMNKTIDEVFGMKCHKLLGATCCCDGCGADRVVGGPRHTGCRFTIGDDGQEYECVTLPYFKDGKLKIILQHLRPIDKNE